MPIIPYSDAELNVLGRAIKERRLAHKYTREQFAEMIGITPDHLNKIERGERGVSIEVLFRIARLLHMSIDTLITRDYVAAERFVHSLLAGKGNNAISAQTAMCYIESLIEAAEKDERPQSE